MIIAAGWEGETVGWGWVGGVAASSPTLWELRGSSVVERDVAAAAAAETAAAAHLYSPA